MCENAVRLICGDLLLVLGLQDLGTFLAQLRAIAAKRKCPALLDITHVEGCPSHASLTCFMLLECL